jgi:PAS domain S-box-containing protein
MGSIRTAAGKMPGFLIPIAVFLLGLTATGIAWELVRRDARADAELRFQARADEIESAIVARLRAYEQVLVGAAALFAASEDVSRGEFRTYVEALRLAEDFPGIQGVGFSLAVPSHKYAHTEQRIRGEGFPDFKIWPPGARSFYSAIIYLEPFKDRNLRAFGYDMYSEPVRRQAMDLAMEENRTAMSGPVKLVQETATDVQLGFLMYVPTYRANAPRGTSQERRANLTGWTYAPFRIRDFMRGILAQEYGEVANSLDLEARDQDGTIMFDSGLDTPASVTLRTERHIQFGGRKWQIVLEGTEDYIRAADPAHRSLLVALAGLGATISATIVLWLLLGHRERQEAERRKWINAAAMDGFWYLDLRGVILETNDAYCAMSGYSKEELSHMEIASVSTEPERVRERITAIVERGSARFETAHRKKDGSLFPIEVSARFVPGDPGRIVCFIRDMTAARAAESALRDSESRFRLLVESLREVVYTLDAEGRHTGVYGSWVEASGLTPDFFLGRTVREILGPEAAPVHETALKRALAGEFVVYSWTLGEKYYETSLSPLTQNGVVSGVVGIGRDVSEREQMKQALERNEKLRSIGTLAGGLAHDFNNLLGGIFGHIEAAITLSQNARQSEILQRAMNTMERARKLTGQLLTFSRAGSPEVRPHDLSELIRKAVSFSLTGSAMKAVFDVPESVVAVLDPDQIEQVIDNIVINARQATGDTGLLYISAASLERTADIAADLPPGRFVRVSVRDTGPGMTADVRNRVFDPFFSTKGEGRGLGLATAYSIVRRHGGTITVESAPGQGTAFHIYLPEGEQIVHEIKVEQSSLTTSGARLLVMDDEPAMRESLTELLSLRGYSVGAAGDGTEALRMFHEAQAASQPYAALLLDLTVPGGMGGIELADTIRRTDPITPIILMSGYAADFAPAMLAEKNICSTLTKPFTLAELSRVVEDCIHGAVHA